MRSCSCVQISSFDEFWGKFKSMDSLRVRVAFLRLLPTACGYQKRSLGDEGGEMVPI